MKMRKYYKRKKHIMTMAWTGIVCLFFLFMGLPQAVNAEALEETDEQLSCEGATIVHSGKSGDLDWSIDSDGLLTISGTGDYAFDGHNREGEHESPKWTEYRDEIVTAKVTVSGITRTWYMFYNCHNLKSIDLSGLETGQVTYMDYMFIGCRSLTSLNVSRFNTSKVTDMSFMFCGCRKLTSLNVGGFNTSQVTNMDGMFSNCISLTCLDVSGFNTSQVTSMYRMFKGCESLLELDVSSFDYSHIYNNDIGDFANSCSSLKQIKFGKQIPKGINIPLPEGTYPWKDANGYVCNYVLTELEESMTYTRQLYPVVNVQVTDGTAILDQSRISFTSKDGTKTYQNGDEVPEGEYEIYLDKAQTGRIIQVDKESSGTISISLKNYVITFFDDKDGKVLQQSKVIEGAFPVYGKATPVKAESNEKKYTFKGWDHPLVAANGDTAYYAVYTEEMIGNTSSGGNGSATSGQTGGGSVKTPSSPSLRTVKYKKAVYVLVGNELILKNASNKKIKKFVIPDTIKVDGKEYPVKQIAVGAFSKCTKLKSVTIGKNVKTIGAKAFFKCKNLKELVINSTTLTKKSVGVKAFKGTSGKITVTVPTGKNNSYKKILKAKGISKKAKYRMEVPVYTF